MDHPLAKIAQIDFLKLDERLPVCDACHTQAVDIFNSIYPLAAADPLLPDGFGNSAVRALLNPEEECWEAYTKQHVGYLKRIIRDQGDPFDLDALCEKPTASICRGVATSQPLRGNP